MIKLCYLMIICVSEEKEMTSEAKYTAQELEAIMLLIFGTVASGT